MRWCCVRDVTDLRRRDRELVTKDATIREIHHRVKNNLQTVAALLRLQARRIDVRRRRRPRSRRRYAGSGSIAIVHETLSQAVEETSTSTRSPTGWRGWSPTSASPGARVGCAAAAFGVLTSEAATALAMVLTEVLQNAVEHGYVAETQARPAVDRGRAHRTPVGCTSPSTTTGPGCPRGSTWRGRPTWGSPSSGRWWSPSWGVRSSVGAAPRGRGTRVVLDVPCE